VPDEEHKPRLKDTVDRGADPARAPSIALTDSDRDAATDALRIAAEKRTEGILGNSRTFSRVCPKSVGSHREIRRFVGRI
jgi:hypothetical protein